MFHKNKTKKSSESGRLDNEQRRQRPASLPPRKEAAINTPFYSSDEEFDDFLTSEEEENQLFECNIDIYGMRSGDQGSSSGSISTGSSASASLGRRRSSMSLIRGRRIDKRETGAKHTTIVSSGDNTTTYELMGTLDASEAKLLHKQTKMHRTGKVILGKGNFGLVRLVRDQDGKFMAVKKIRNISAFRNEHKFLKFMERQGVEGALPVHNTLTLPSSKGQRIIYQIMPIANLGSGRDLQMNFTIFTEREKKVLLRYLTKFFIETFAKLDKKSIYHGDFKSDNFLLNLSKQGVNIYLSDFGAAAHFNEEGSIDLLVGNWSDVLYFSPERGAKQHGMDNQQALYRQQEVWRIGLTLLSYADPAMAQKYYLLARDLFDQDKQLTENEKSYEAWIDKFTELHEQLNEALKASHIPTTTRRFIMRALEPRWQNRILIKDVKKTDLRSVDEEEVTALLRRYLKHKEHANKVPKLEKKTKKELAENQHKHHESAAILFNNKHLKKREEEEQKDEEEKTEKQLAAEAARPEVKRLSLKELPKKLGRAASFQFNRFSPRLEALSPGRKTSGSAPTSPKVPLSPTKLKKSRE